MDNFFGKVLQKNLLEGVFLVVKVTTFGLVHMLHATFVLSVLEVVILYEPLQGVKIILLLVTIVWYALHNPQQVQEKLEEFLTHNLHLSYSFLRTVDMSQWWGLIQPCKWYSLFWVWELGF